MMRMQTYELTIGGEVDVEQVARTKSKEQAQVSGASHIEDDARTACLPKIRMEP